jgi:Lar family restriction alleviation protein
MSALAPCPFCGGREVQVYVAPWDKARPALHSQSRNRSMYAVECLWPSCEATGPLADTQAEAGMLWNRRARQVREPSPQLDLIGGEA